VWLASYSRQNNRGFIATGKWKEDAFERGYAMLSKALTGVGTNTKERLFRMNITLCLHRAAREEEIAELPEGWQKAPTGMAGGPVALIWSHGIPCVDSCKPCENPTHQVLYDKRPDLWVPLDCGKCPPCVARAKIENRPNDLASFEASKKGVDA